MPAATVASPCNRICTLDQAQVCIGCGRQLDEIVEWPSAGETRRLEIRALAEQRLAIIRRPPEEQA